MRSSRSWKKRTTLAADLTWRKVANTKARRLCTSWLGCLAGRLADQAYGEELGQFTALGLVEQSGVQAALQGVQFQFCDQALQAQDQAAIGRGRVIDALLVADETVAVATQVEQLIPIGAVAGQTGNVVGKENSRGFLVDEGHQFL